MWHLKSRLVLTASLALAVASTAFAGDLRFEHVKSIGSEGVGEGQFEYVEDFAFSKDGHLIVTDASHAWVQVFHKSTGQFLARFGGKGDRDHNLDKPEGIADALDRFGIQRKAGADAGVDTEADEDTSG